MDVAHRSLARRDDRRKRNDVRGFGLVLGHAGEYGSAGGFAAPASDTRRSHPKTCALAQVVRE